MFKTLRSRVTATYFAVVLISLLLASFVFLFFFVRYQRNKERSDLKAQVGVIAGDIRRIFTATPQQLKRRGFSSQPEPQPPTGSKPAQGTGEQPEPGNYYQLVQTVLNLQGQVLRARLFLVNREGTVVSQSLLGPPIQGSELDLPRRLPKAPRKVNEQLLTRTGKRLVVVSAPTLIDQTTEGFLIAAKPLGEIGPGIASLVWYIVIAAAVAMGISMLLAVYLSNAVSGPVRAVTEAARKMAAGDYGQEVPVTGSDETGELARDFNVMAERVRTAYELQRNFVGNVSHELRTPLTSIEGFSQALLDGVCQGEEEKQRSLEIINQESKRLVRVLRDLLLLSQIDAGELKPEKKPVDLVDLIRKMESLYIPRTEAECVELKVSYPPQSISVYTDPDRLERVLTNLLDNALKYTSSGGTVALSAATGVEWFSISVADTGQGIAPELLPLIFDRFYRVEKSRSTRHGGAGLGLSISKELVETLGGRIAVQSLVGQGTIFTITFPL